MTHYLKLIRWQNLALIALVQILIKYALLLPFSDSHGVSTSLSVFAFILLVIATLCLAAAGYVINDISDVDADKINKPQKVIINKQVSEKTALTLFIILNLVGVGIGYYISSGIGHSGFFAIFFIVSTLLYLYSTYLKHIALVGNLTISLLVATSIVLIGIFELLPAIDASNRAVQMTFFKIILDYAAFAFLINLVRELVKDIEDIDGDFNIGSQTLPIVLGRERANKIAFALSLLPIAAVIYYIVTYLFTQTIVVLYFLALVVGPLIYVSIKLFSAEKKEHYHHISIILKLIMLTGLMSMALYPIILK